ncbi:hypothetical protein RFI_20109, partial [Reticulomyxa filosa]
LKKGKRSNIRKQLSQLFKIEPLNSAADAGHAASQQDDKKVQLSPINEDAEKQAPEIGIQTVLADWDGFQLFMQHVTTEFSMENLLAIVELTQFQQYYHFDRVKVDAEEANSSDTFVELPLDKIPHSAIVYDKNLNIQQKCVELCEKYVLAGSIHELNISYKTRKYLTDLYNEQFSSKTVSECSFAFDKVIQELCSVILDSFWRFRDTHIFQEWASKKYT